MNKADSIKVHLAPKTGRFNFEVVLYLCVYRFMQCLRERQKEALVISTISDIIEEHVSALILTAIHPLMWE